MTFCLGMRVREGLVGLADTRIISGNECLTARKIATFRGEGYSLFVMTSGLRSVRDKTLTYFAELMEDRSEPFARTFKAVNAFAEQLRRVAAEDKQALEDSGLSFSISALIGGQFPQDKEPRLYLVYPQGNWVEIGPGTPYAIIGATGYGKPVLDRTLRFEDSLRLALKVGCLAFDSTRISASDVDFPLDVILYANGVLHEHRYERHDLRDVNTWWQDRLRELVQKLPSDWMDTALRGLAEGKPDS